jgi:hypothetical protein
MFRRAAGRGSSFGSCWRLLRLSWGLWVCGWFYVTSPSPHRPRFRPRPRFRLRPRFPPSGASGRTAHPTCPRVLRTRPSRLRPRSNPLRPLRRSKVHLNVHMDVHMDNILRSTPRHQSLRLPETQCARLSFRLPNPPKTPRTCPILRANRCARSIAQIPLPNRHRMCTG